MIEHELSRAAQNLETFELASSIGRRLGQSAREIVRRDIAVKLTVDRGNGSPLTDRHLPSLERANLFLQARFKQFGVVYPEDISIVDKARLPPYVTAGAQAPERRIFFADAEALSPLEFEGFLVHELTHATGSVLVQARALEEEVVPELTYQRGWLRRRTRSPEKLFSALEEYGAESNRREYLRSLGVREEVVSKSLQLNLSPHYQCDMRLKAIVKEILPATIETGENGQDYLRFSIPYRYTVLPRALSGAEYHGYNPLVWALDCIATEIYPESPVDDAVAQFRFEIAKAAANGEPQSVLQRVQMGPGTETVRFLAEVPTSPKSENIGAVFSALYAKAGLLPGNRSAAMRKELRELLSYAYSYECALSEAEG
jgi:hypothetical protein